MYRISNFFLPNPFPCTTLLLQRIFAAIFTLVVVFNIHWNKRLFFKGPVSTFFTKRLWRTINEYYHYLCLTNTLWRLEPIFDHFSMSLAGKIFLHIWRLKRCAFSNILRNVIAFFILPLFPHMSFCNPFWLLLCKEMQFFSPLKKKKLQCIFTFFDLLLLFFVTQHSFYIRITNGLF